MPNQQATAAGKARADATGRNNLAAGRAVMAARRRRRMADLCDLLSEGIAVKAAAKMIGISEAAATNMMAQVRAELGWQAQ